MFIYLYYIHTCDRIRSTAADEQSATLKSTIIIFTCVLSSSIESWSNSFQALRASLAWWCGVLQCVAVCCSVLQCVAVRRNERCVAVRCSAMRCSAVHVSMLQYVAVCCSVLQCVAVCCSSLQCIAVCHCLMLSFRRSKSSFFCVAEYCSVLQCIAVCCSVLQWVAVSCTASWRLLRLACHVAHCAAVRCRVLQCVMIHWYHPSLGLTLFQIFMCWFLSNSLLFPALLSMRV